jgi:predicted SnoaL-like aldol condensation-catalyzing enzyme
MADFENNKKVVVDFYNTAFAEKDPEKALMYVGDYYRQHNPNVPDGKDAFLAFAKQRAVESPGRVFDIKRVIAEGDYVVLHSYHVFQETDKDYPDVPHGRVAADIFRLENGKIVEHWDVLQAVPAKAVHNNTMY